MDLKFETYPLSHIVSVQAIVSADYVQGVFPAGSRHCHEDAWELCACLGEEIILIKEDKEIVLRAGELAFVQPGCLHDILSHQKESVAFVISFTCSESSGQYLHLMHLLYSHAPALPGRLP